jgi:iron complex outermembrane receptor protein
MSEIARSWSRFALRNTSAFIALGLFLDMASAAPQAQAQTAAAEAPGGLEEIVVTAERRTTDIQATPIAITAIQADTLQKDNITQLADIDGRVPGLEITKSSGYETVVTIRGVGLETPENEPTTSPGVAMFLDGVYLTNSISLDETLFDIDHIEVLRGPPGALYGQSATGGAILIVTKQPKLGEFSGSGDVSYGTYNLHQEQVELNVPLGDKFAVRVSGQNYGHDGFTKDPLIPNNDLDGANDVSGKLAILWQPTDDFKATITTQFYSSDFHGSAQKNINDPNPNPYEVTQDYPSHFALDTNISHLNLEWDLPWFTVKSVTGYQYLLHNQQEDSSRSAFYLTNTYDDVAGWNTHLRSFNEQFDILSNGDTNFDWDTGVFALNGFTRQFVAEFECPSASIFVCTAPTPEQLRVTPNIETNPPGNLVFGQDLRVARQAYAWFAQGTYHITDDLRFTAGVRVNYDATSAETVTFGAGQLPIGTWSLVPTWRAELDYDLTPDNMLYGSYSRGYKPGGINSSNTQNHEAVLATPTFNVETNTAFEVGSKNTFLDKTLSLNVAAFYYDYRNMQFVATDPLEFAGGVENIPSIHEWGGEAEAHYRGLQQKLHADASLSLMGGEVAGDYYTIDSTIQQHLIATVPACQYGGAFYNPACFAAEEAANVNIKGKSPAKLPGVLASFTLAYDISIPDAMVIPAGTFTPRISYVYRGTEEQRIFNQPNVDSVPAYSLVNLNFEYVPLDSNLSIQFIVTNLFDKAGVISRYTDPYGTFTTSQQFTPPRQILGKVAYSFVGDSGPETAPAAYTPPPVQAPAPPPSVAHSYMVFFDFNKSDLTPQAIAVVDQAAKNAAPAKATELVVTGHTDTVGSDAYNMRLSRRRAESVAAELEKQGIASSEIEIVAKGKQDLLVPTKDGVREPQNRRVTIVYSGGATS